MGQDDQQKNDGAQDISKNAAPQPGVGSGAGASAPATSSNPTQQSQPESAGAGLGDKLPAAVVSPEEQLEQATAAAKANAALLPPIPDDATLADARDDEILELAAAYDLPGNSRSEDIDLLKKRRDGVQLKSMAHPNDAFTDFDPTNPREFDPTVVLLHLERDGVIVEGFIDPFSGKGVQDLLVKLQDELVKARAREDGAAPAHVQVGETPDPNALKRQRAIAAGHDIDPETKRCRNCHNAEWWCLEGNPCEPREDAAEPAPIEEPANGEADSPSP